MKITIRELGQIDEAARQFIAAMGPARVIAFYGKMGVGKTTFIKALCEQLGVHDVITSPTFAIVNEYEASGVTGGICHFDFYRIKRLEEVYDMGYEDYFFSGRLCLIEWPELIETLLPDDAMRVYMNVESDGSRTISLSQMSRPSLLDVCHGEKSKDENPTISLSQMSRPSLLDACHGEKSKDEIQRLKLDETVSTNQWLRDHDGPHDMVVWTDFQSAGRGCGSNSWESERGKNLLFSMRHHPHDLPARRQFRISMAVALALRDVLTRWLQTVITVKWPNDIYWQDRKMAGILIENRLKGALIDSSIIGIGLNINQREFLSDAPNPVSMCQIAGHEFDREALLADIIDEMERRLNAVDDLSEEYQLALYRRTGFHHYSDKDGDFEAEIAGVKPDGRIILRDTDGHERIYAFKEVRNEKL